MKRIMEVLLRGAIAKDAEEGSVPGRPHGVLLPLPIELNNDIILT